MRLINRLLGGAPAPDMAALYAQVVAIARRPGWYRAGGVPDTLDGRFDMVALILALVLLRFELEGKAGGLPAARLTERFVADMDGQLRETGFGDLVVGKQVGFAMGALGGRLGAYRGGISDDALVRNVWRGAQPAPQALAATQAMIAAVQASLAATPFPALVAGIIG